MLHASIRCLDTLQSIFEGYFRIELGIKRDAEGRPVFPEHGSKLRSARHRVGFVERLVYPALGKYPIGEIRRSDLIRMLDKIAEKNGEVMSDHVLAIVRKLMNWHASRSDEFRSPIVPGMARTKPSERARDRVLSDDELRAVWRTAEAHGGLWGALLRFLLTTIQAFEDWLCSRSADTFEKPSHIRSTSNHIPRDVKVVTIAAWREESYRRGISTSDRAGPGNWRQRACEQLIGAGEVATRQPTSGSPPRRTRQRTKRTALKSCVRLVRPYVLRTMFAIVRCSPKMFALAPRSDDRGSRIVQPHHG